jgi:hypothetical protein
VSIFQPTSIAFDGYALAKSGRRDEARAVLKELLKLSTSVSLRPTTSHLFITCWTNERDKTHEWLEKGYDQLDAKMVFLKVEPKWNNLRDDPRLEDVLRRVGF